MIEALTESRSVCRSIHFTRSLDNTFMPSFARIASTSLFVATAVAFASSRATAQSSEPPASAPNATVQTGTIAAGTILTASATDKVCSNTHKVGDRVAVTLQDAVIGTYGVALPAGASIGLRITKLPLSLYRWENAMQPPPPADLPPESGTDSARAAAPWVTLAPEAVVVGDKTYPLQADVTAFDGALVRDTTAAGAKSPPGAALVGAVVGTVLAGKQGTEPGRQAAINAPKPAGARVFMFCLPAGAPVTLRLSTPLTLLRP